MVLLFMSGKSIHIVLGFGSMIIISDILYTIYKRFLSHSPKLQQKAKKQKKVEICKKVEQQLLLKGNGACANKAPAWYRHLERPVEFWKRPHQELWNTALFFPEIFPEREGSQTRQLLWYMEQAKKSIKVALYTANFMLLESALFKLAKNRVQVKGVVDNGRVIRTWRKHGILVREKPKLEPSPYDARLYLDHMHNKFIIIDDKAIITGSLNWTVSAVTENRENVLITNDPHTVKEYVQEFDNLWDKSDPKFRPKKEVKKFKYRNVDDNNEDATKKIVVRGKKFSIEKLF